MKCPPQIARAIANYQGKHAGLRELQMQAWGYQPEKVGGQWMACTIEERDKARQELKVWALGIEE
jgi:hypothetical protein